MHTNTFTILKDTMKLLADREKTDRLDGYDALADTLRNHRRKIERLLIENVDDDRPYGKERPFIAKGLDGEMYLVFNGSCDAGTFLNNLGINEFSVGLHHFDGYENAIRMDLEPKPKKKITPEFKDCLHEAATWLRAISSWLLTHDHDMSLPDGVLDTDPLDIAEKLEQFRR